MPLIAIPLTVACCLAAANVYGPRWLNLAAIVVLGVAALMPKRETR
jgi:hypothetical protein